MQFADEPGATPIDPDEAAGLIPDWLATKSQLNRLEAENIAAAAAWASSGRADILRSHYVRELHKRMFGEVWAWAGTFRGSDKNIGIPWERVPTALEDLLRNTDHQITHNVFGADELAARFHHRLVFIHCFPNGNGRHARLMTEILLTKRLGRESFTWGEATGGDKKHVRDTYIAALKAADGGDFGALFAFVRT
jgi:Fic-DOC domain mobile mystery protein B